jgi:uncharacterized protein DUF4154
LEPYRTRRWLWRTAGLIAVLAMACVFMVPVRLRAQSAELPEIQVKAAFLFNFIKFVDWPATSFVKASSSISVCIVGSDEFSSAFEGLVKGKELGGRALAVRRSDPGTLSGCHVVYVSESRKRDVQVILREVRGRAVLTVGDVEQFTHKGGVIGFYERDHRLRFSVNPDAGARAGLHISSKLLSLATVVHDQAEGD